MDEAPDAELVRRIAEGGVEGRAAEATLCRRFAPRIRLYGLRHLRDEDRARDLVQAVLLVVLEAARAARIDDPARLDRYVLGTCRNTRLRTQRQRARTEPATEELLASLEAESHERVDVTALMGCFDALELRSKQVVMMSFLEERSAEEVASTLSTTPGNVRVIRHRALAALRRCLDQPRRGAEP